MRLETEQSTNIKNNAKKEHGEKWKNKVTHGYMQKKIDQDPEIETDATNQWLDQRFSAHIEGFICATQEQELNTKATRKRREKDQTKKQSMDVRCRVCKEKEESVYHLISSCPVLAPSMYLLMRHNQVATILYQELLQKPTAEYKPPDVTVTNSNCGTIKMISERSVEWRKIDQILYCGIRRTKPARLLKLRCPWTPTYQLHIRKRKQIHPTYTEPVSLYRQYKYEAVAIVIGVMGAVPKSLNKNIEKLSKYISEEEMKDFDTKNSKGSISRNSQNLENSTEDVTTDTIHTYIQSS